MNLKELEDRGDGYVEPTNGADQTTKWREVQ